MGVPGVELLQLTAVGWGFQHSEQELGEVPREREPGPLSWVHHPGTGWGGSGLGFSVTVWMGAAMVPNKWVPAPLPLC